MLKRLVGAQSVAEHSLDQVGDSEGLSERRARYSRLGEPVSCTRFSVAGMGEIGPDSNDCGARQKSIVEI